MLWIDLKPFEARVVQTVAKKQDQTTVDFNKMVNTNRLTHKVSPIFATLQPENNSEWKEFWAISNGQNKQEFLSRIFFREVLQSQT